MKNLLQKSIRLVIAGMMMNSVLTLSSYAMDILPDEILEHTFKQLPLKKITSAGIVCKKWLYISEKDSLWKHYGFALRKECLEFPFSKLEHEHLVTLFKNKYISGNKIFYWKLIENVEMPEEIMKDVQSSPGIVSVGWKATNPVRIKEGPNLVQFTTELTFCADAEICYYYTKVPYAITFTGNWWPINNVLKEE